MWPFGNRRTERSPRIEPRLLASSPENPETSLSDPAQWLQDWASGGQAGRFGPSVSERSSMMDSAVHRCVTLRASVPAELPLKIYERTADGRKETPDHPLQDFFRVAPYPDRSLTAFVWRELWGINVDLWGDHVSIIRYDGAGRIIGFEPVMPWDVEVYRLNNRNAYRCTIISSTLGGSAAPTIEWHDQDDVIHIPGPGFNGIRGMSRIRAFARNAVSLSRSLEEQVGRIHENAARPSGLVVVPQSAAKNKTSFDLFKSQFDENSVGRHNVGRVVFGDIGSAYTPFQMSLEDLNTIEARRYQVADISRFYGVPLHLLNETEKATSWGTGLSEQTLGLLIYTLNPELGRTEAELNKKLFVGTNYYIEYDRDALMAMDALKSAQVAQTEIASGVLLINERRRHKNRPPVEHGDQALINGTNVPLAKLFAPGAQPRFDPITGAPVGGTPAQNDNGVAPSDPSAAETGDHNGESGK